MPEAFTPAEAPAGGATLRIGNASFPWRHGRVVTVGRDSACDVVIDDATISRVHLRVEALGDGTWLLRDADSLNGVFVAGQRVATLPLRLSAQVRIGAADGTALSLEIVPAAPAAPASAGTAGPPQAAAPAAASAARAPAQVRPPGAGVGPAGAAAMPPGGVSRPAETGLGRQLSSYVPGGDQVTIGRDPASTIVIADDLLVSRRHAQLRRYAGGVWEVRDLGSHNGTFVNGERISRTALRDDDLLTVGNHIFVFQDGRLEEYSQTDDVSLEAMGLTVRADGGATLLSDVSFSLGSRSVLALVGPSGAGKSTLLRALTGVLNPASGQVVFAGRDLHSSYDEFRYRIGSVPQDDLVHSQLTPRSELELAAALRLPPDVGRGGRRARVDQVLAELGLEQRADLQISKLSGGQRKRVSVGAELLTQPSLLFLDEPTSGLDPGNEKQVMTVLRQLADGGRIVVVVTHATQSLDLADRVLFLARGGRVAYFGPPEGALEYFARHGVTGGYADIFRALDDPGETDWGEVFRADPEHERFVGHAARQAAVRRGAGRMSSARAASPVPARGQFRVLVSRQVKILAGDRRALILLAAQAPVFGLIIAFLFTPTTMSTNHGPFAALICWLLVVSATWLGASGTIREIVKELPIYRRERAVGLSIPAYVGSKAFVFGVITVVQSFLVVVIGLARQSLPPRDPRHFIIILHRSDPHLFKGVRPFDAGSVLGSQLAEIAVAVALAGLTGTALGLAISGLVRKSDQAVFLLPVVLVIEMALSLPMLKLANSSPLIQQASKIASANWGMSAVASTVSMNQLMTPYLWDLTFGQAEIAGVLTNGRIGLPPKADVIKELATDPSWNHTGSAWLTSVLVLVLMMAALLGVAVLALRRMDIGRSGRSPAPAAAAQPAGQVAAAAPSASGGVPAQSPAAPGAVAPPTAGQGAPGAPG